MPTGAKGGAAAMSPAVQGRVSPNEQVARQPAGTVSCVSGPPAAVSTAQRPAPLLIVTRPAGPAAALVAELQYQGLRAQALPLIGIAALDDPSPLTQTWASLPGFDVVMFVSAHAVQGLFAAQPAGVSWPASTWAASTGPGTTAALRAAGLPLQQIVQPDPDAGQFDSEALWRQLQPRHAHWQGRQVLVVRGEQGRDWLADALQALGATVQFVAAYRRVAPCLTAKEAALLQAAMAQPEDHLWLFSSSEAIGHLRALAPTAEWSRSRAWATHPRIAQAARAIGFADVELLALGGDALVNRLRAGALRT